jgi:hypothetical protein
MPFTRISLLPGKPPADLEALPDSLHRALVEAFEVPPDDRFQAIHQHEPGELVFAATGVEDWSFADGRMTMIDGALPC